MLSGVVALDPVHRLKTAKNTPGNVERYQRSNTFSCLRSLYSQHGMFYVEALLYAKFTW